MTDTNTSNFHDFFPTMYKEGYLDALKRREAHKIFGQADDYGELTEQPTVESSIVLKKVNVEDEGVPKANMLNFFIDHTFINAALQEYRSTWDPNTGNMLKEYYENRDLFLQKYESGEYGKKK